MGGRTMSQSASYVNLRVAVGRARDESQDVAEIRRGNPKPFRVSADDIDIAHASAGREDTKIDDASSKGERHRGVRSFVPCGADQ